MLHILLPVLHGSTLQRALRLRAAIPHEEFMLEVIIAAGGT